MKKIFSFFLCALLIVTSSALRSFAAPFSDENVRASGEENGFLWTLDSEGVLTVTGNGENLPAAFRVGDYASPGAWYEYTNDIREVILNCGIPHLEELGLKLCPSFTALTVSGVEVLSDGSYGSGAFANCKKLRTVTIGPGVSVIGKYTFHYCSELRSVVMGADVSRIRNSAFGLCRELESVLFTSGDVTVEKNGFAFCGNDPDQDLEIVIPGGKTVLADDSFYDSDALIRFLGDIPEFQGELNTYSSGKIVCEYPCGRETWDRPLPITAEWRKNHVFSKGTPVEENGVCYLDFLCERCGENGRVMPDLVTCAGASFSVNRSGTPTGYSVSTEDGTSVDELGVSTTGFWSGDVLLNGKVYYKFAIGIPGMRKLIFETDDGVKKTYLIYLRSHEWDDGTVTEQPNCGREGVMVFTCPLCKSTKTSPIPKTDGHVWDNGVETLAATTESEGEITFTCHVCGETKTEPSPKLCAHVWDDGVIVRPPTESKEGERKHTCLLCGEFMWVVIPRKVPGVLSGDADLNGVLEAADARLVLRAAVGLEILSDEQTAAADADHSGLIEAADARLVLRAAVGLDTLI